MKDYILASDFDETLSLEDSGVLLGRMLGIPEAEFRLQVASLSRLNLVQQGGELAYLLGHDPRYSSVTRDHLIEIGKTIRLKDHVRELFRLLGGGIEGLRLSPYVISAAPEEIVRSALAEMLPAENVFGTRIRFDGAGRLEGIVQVPAGFGKVAVLESIQAKVGVGGDRIIYVGDGGSDHHVMLHVNRHEGLAISVSEARHVSKIARRTVLSDDALSVLVPILEEIARADRAAIRGFFDANGLQIEVWERIRCDRLTFRDTAERLPLANGEATELRHA